MYMFNGLKVAALRAEYSCSSAGQNNCVGSLGKTQCLRCFFPPNGPLTVRMAQSDKKQMHVQECENNFQFCVHSVGSDTTQGFHQSLYSCLFALQEEEWELFQCTLDNAKYVITE